MVINTRLETINHPNPSLPFYFLIIGIKPSNIPTVEQKICLKEYRSYP